MATLRIWWHKVLPRSESGGIMPIPAEPEIATVTVTTSGSAAQSAAAPSLTDVAIVLVDTNTRYRVGGDAADATGKLITADVERAINVKPGQTISFINA